MTDYLPFEVDPRDDILRPQRDLHSWLAIHPELADAYRAKIWDELGPSGCHVWLGALNGNTGHAKVHVRYERWTDPDGNTRTDEWVVYGHQLSWLLGGNQLEAGQVLRHRCDEPFCQNSTHLESGDVSDNLRDWHRRKWDWYGALNDPRGPAGRAKAVRRAILEAGADVADQIAAYRSAIAAGREARGQLTLLPVGEPLD